MKHTLFFMLLSAWLFAPAAWADEGEYDISLMNAGTLLDQIGIENIEKVYGLKVSGDLNGTDILTIRKMTNLRCLDMENANIVNGGLSYYADYITSQNTVGTYFFREKTNLEKIVLPKTVKNIEDYSFSSCTGLTSVTIPENVTYICSHVFSGCTALRNLRIEDDTETLSLSTSSSSTPFDDCPLDTVYLGRNIDYGYWSGYRTYYNSPFKNKTSLVSLTIGNQVTYIGVDAFYGCTGLTSVTIPESVTTIGSDAFSGCTGLKNLRIEDGTKALSYSATPFNDCPLDTVYLGRNNPYISSPFENKTTLVSLIIGNQVTFIGDFSGCTGLTSVTIGEGVQTIGSNAFSGCYGLTEITIPESVTSINNDAFKGCSGLTSVTIGEGVQTISSNAFSGCYGLTEITIPESVTYIGVDAFYGCTGLKNLRIEDGTKTLVFYISKSTSSNLFDGCPLDTVYLGRNYKCINFDDKYYYDLFKGKTSLVSLTIGNQVTSIGSSAFSGCKGLTEVTIPESITSIGKNAFYNCTGLKSVTAYNPTPVNIVYNGISVFDGVDYETCKLYVLAGSVSTYKAAEGWKEFGTILPIEGYVPETGKDFIPVTVTPTDSAEVKALKTFTLAFMEAPSLVDTTAALLNETGTLSYLADLAAGEGNTLVVTLKCDTLKAAGTYTLTIPEGTFGDAAFAADPTTGHCNPALTYIYTIKVPQPVKPELVKDFMPTSITPADSSEVEALKTFTLVFTETPSLVDTTAALLNEAGTISYLADLAAGEGNTLVVTLKCDTLTAAGTYTLTIPEGTFGDAAFAADPTTGHCNPALTYTYYIVEDTVPDEPVKPELVKDFMPTGITPADSSEVEALKTFTLAFTETPSLVDTTAALLNEAGTLSYLADLAAGEGNTLVVTLKCDTLKAAGTYTLTIPEGTFGDAAFAADPTTGHCNPALTYIYTIKEQQPVEPDEPEQDFEPVTVTPEAGSEEISFTRVTLAFMEAPVLLDNRVMLAKSDSTVLYPALLTLGESNTLEITLRYGELKTEGTYLLNIPAGTVRDASGKHVNPEYTYVYTLTQEAGSVPTPGAEAAGITVYNLQGILMLQTDEAAELRTLPAGDYIVNGKKTVIAEQ